MEIGDIVVLTSRSLSWNPLYRTSTSTEGKTEFWPSEITIATASTGMCLNPNEISPPNDVVILILTKEFQSKRVIVYSAVAFNHVTTGG